MKCPYCFGEVTGSKCEYCGSKLNNASDTKAQTEPIAISNSKPAKIITFIFNKILSLIKWILSVFFLFVTIMDFSNHSFLSGIIFAFMTVLLNPEFTKFLAKKGIRIKKRFSFIFLFILFFVGVSLSKPSSSGEGASSDDTKIEAVSSDMNETATGSVSSDVNETATGSVSSDKAATDIEEASSDKTETNTEVVPSDEAVTEVSPSTETEIETTNTDDSSNATVEATKMDYDSLQLIFLKLSVDTTEDDILSYISSYSLPYGYAEFNGTPKSIQYKIAFEKGVTPDKHADSGDYIRVVFNKTDGTFMYAEYHNNSLFATAFLYSYGTYWKLHEELNNDYVGFYYYTPGESTGGITINYSNGAKSETGYHPAANAADAIASLYQDAK